MFESLSKQEKEEKLQQEKEDNFNQLIKSYNYAVERKSPEHHRLAVEVAEAYKSLNYKESFKKSVLKQYFINLLEEIKEWRVFNMFNQKKVEGLTEEQKNQFDSLLNEYEESSKELQTNREGELYKENKKRYHQAAKNLAEFNSRYDLNHH